MVAVHVLTKGRTFEAKEKETLDVALLWSGQVSSFSQEVIFARLHVGFPSYTVQLG